MLTAAVGTYLVIGLVALIAGYLYYKVDDKLEDRHRNYLKVSRILSDNGLEKIPAFLDNLAIMDYDGALHQVRVAAELFQDPDQVKLEFDKVLEKLVLKKASLSDGKEYLVKLLERVTPGTVAIIADAAVAKKAEVVAK